MDIHDIIRKTALEKIGPFPNYPTVVWLFLDMQRRRTGKTVFTRGSVKFLTKDHFVDDDKLELAIHDLITLGRLKQVSNKTKIEYELLPEPQSEPVKHETATEG